MWKEVRRLRNEGGDGMLTAIFFIALIWVTIKMFAFGMKAAWGIAKFVCTVFLLPVLLIGLVCAGLIYIAIPILIIAGIIAFACGVRI